MFDEHNTSGLPLEFEDVFKIRLYEYLRKAIGEESARSRIIKIYEDCNKNGVDMNAVTNYYQIILITKYNLPTKFIHDEDKSDFFDNLFDALLGKDHKGYENAKGKKLDHTEIDRIIKIIHDWDNSIKQWDKGNYQNYSPEDIFSYCLIKESKYDTYIKTTVDDYGIIVPYLFYHHKEKGNIDKLFEILHELNKLFFIYSICYKRSTPNIHNCR